MLRAVGADLSCAGNSEFSSGVTRIRNNNPTLAWFFRNSFKFFVELVAIYFRKFLSLALTTTFAVAEKL